MNIITETVRNGRVQDGIATILKLDDETFEKVLDRMRPLNGEKENFNFYYTTDHCSRPDRISQLGLEEFRIDGKDVVRGYYANGSEISVQELFPMFEKLLEGFPEGTPIYKRLIRLLETRGLEAFKEDYVNRSQNANSDVVNKVFEILSSQELFDRFLDYENNKEVFAIDGVESPKHEICRTIKDIFGEVQGGRSSQIEKIKKDFYIPELPALQERVGQAYSDMNFDRYTNGLYEYRSPLAGRILSRRGQEPDFTINPELRAAVYDGMPKDLSLEEKTVYVYAKLCKELLYDEGTLYKRRMARTEYNLDFSKEVMEGIKPGSKVDCVNFSRIFAKFINEFDGDIGAVVLVNGDGTRLHSFVGVYTDRMSGTFDGTGTEKGNPTDDLMKAKLGLRLFGICGRFDDDRVLSKAVQKVYPMVLGREPVTELDYMKQLNIKEKPKFGEDDLGKRVRVAVELGKEKSLYGNELTQFLDAISHLDFFGPYLEKFYIGRKTKRDEQESHDRIILFRRSMFGEENNNPFYVVETKNGEVLELSREEVEKQYKGCEWESELHECPDVNLGEKLEGEQEDKTLKSNPEAPVAPTDHGDR